MNTSVLTINAHAKINLTLEVVRLRSDGYHDIASIMQKVTLHDSLKIELADDISFACDPPMIDIHENLVARAAHILKQQTGSDLGARLTLTKRIPVSSGLGGGSSDAAAALVGLNTLWDLGMKRSELLQVALQLGSDVPFFLYEGTALVQGKGEIVNPILTPETQQWILILTPSIFLPNKTGTMYRGLNKENYSQGHLTQEMRARIQNEEGIPLKGLFNVFDKVAIKVFNDLEKYWQTFSVLGAREIHLAGSGPSLYALVPSKEIGGAIRSIVQSRYGWETHLVTLWPNGNEFL